MKNPPYRKLRGFAFDPSLSLKLETVEINKITYKIIWEDLEPIWEDLEPIGRSGNNNEKPQGVGPSGEYIEVVDFDPTIKQLYEPVDLNHKFILAQDGLDPSESNPQFHQQMVYAVAMTTIQNFEKALGRKVIWASRLVNDPKIFEEYVQRIRIYPHALREANAYYSPQKKAILFGYFNATPSDRAVQMPNAIVFTCLSHDIIAHEVTHAILDGMHRSYSIPSNPDVLAFHEAIADIVALFQHFTFPEVLKHQISKTRGDLSKQNLLGQLAQEFGSSIGSYGSLRDAIGKVNEKTKVWEPIVPHIDDYLNTTEPHARGSILVAAVFEAFITLYSRRVSDLIRIASNGSGILPQGEIHPDLVNRMALEASKVAGHVLQMCIRAIDYCPPVDITFGDYLRALITSDYDLIQDDSRDYRLAFIEAFRRRGIYPSKIKTLSVDNLKYESDPKFGRETEDILSDIGSFLREYRNEVIYENNRLRIFNSSRKYIRGDDSGNGGLHDYLEKALKASFEFEKLTGLIFSDWRKFGMEESKKYGKTNVSGPSIQIRNLRLVFRTGPLGNQINNIFFTLVQRCRVEISEDFVRYKDSNVKRDLEPNEFDFFGGCTLIFDLDTLKIKYAITKPLLDIDTSNENDLKIDEERILRQYKYMFQNSEEETSEYIQYFTQGLTNSTLEPFSLIHKH